MVVNLIVIIFIIVGYFIIRIKGVKVNFGNLTKVIEVYEARYLDLPLKLICVI